MNTFFAMNRHFKTVMPVTGIQSFEELQCMFRFGIVMYDGQQADAIGQCKSVKDLESRAAKSGITVLQTGHNSNPFYSQMAEEKTGK